jgi:hypothetical protein
MARACAAVTYADLGRLFADLPGPRGRRAPRPPAIARLPTALEVLWTVWLAVVPVALTGWVVDDSLICFALICFAGGGAAATSLQG